MKLKRKICIVFSVLIFLFFLVFIHIEKQPFSIVYSSVFSTPEQTEIHLYVQMNTWAKVDKNIIAEEIISEHQRIHQIKDKVMYTLHLYRTGIHYRWEYEYDTINCDKNGAIICCRGS